MYLFLLKGIGLVWFTCNQQFYGNPLMIDISGITCTTNCTYTFVHLIFETSSFIQLPSLY